MNTIFEDYVGIDVSKEWVDIALDNNIHRIDQTEKSFKKFIKIHKLHNKNLLVVLESTVGYEQLAVRSFSQAKITVHIAHPNKVKAFARAKGRLAKTDKIDAMLLREYGSFINPEEIKPVQDIKQYELHLLGSRLEQLKEMHHQESCRLGIASKAVKQTIQSILNLLKKEIEKIKESILQIINNDADLKEKFNILCSMKGVGETLAMVLITHLPELGSANKKEIAALVGVAPITNQSGQRTGKAMTKYGRHGVRKILYMAALTACRYNDKMKTFYTKLIAAGKLKKVAIIAVMRRMIVILNAMMQSKKYYFA